MHAWSDLVFSKCTEWEMETLSPHWMQRAASSRVASLCSSPDEECNRSKCFVVSPMKNNSVKINLPSLFVATATCLQPLFPCSLVKAHCFHASADDTSAVYHLSCTLRDSLNYRSGLHTNRSVCFCLFFVFSFRSNPEICNITFPSSLLK